MLNRKLGRYKCGTEASPILSLGSLGETHITIPRLSLATPMDVANASSVFHSKSAAQTIIMNNRKGNTICKKKISWDIIIGPRS